MEQSEDETEAEAAISEIEQKYPGALREDNVNEIPEAALARKEKI